MDDDTLREHSEAYIDRLFGAEMGRRHTSFLAGLGHDRLEASLHRYHVLEDDERWLSVEDNYLIGLCVLCAQGRYSPAAMFAKTLRHRGVPKERIAEAVSRLEMWVGGVPAAEAMAVVQRAVREYDETGLRSMRGWFPEGGEHA